MAKSLRNKPRKYKSKRTNFVTNKNKNKRKTNKVSKKLSKKLSKKRRRITRKYRRRQIGGGDTTLFIPPGPLESDNPLVGRTGRIVTPIIMSTPPDFGKSVLPQSDAIRAARMLSNPRTPGVNSHGTELATPLNAAAIELLGNSSFNPKFRLNQASSGPFQQPITATPQEMLKYQTLKEQLLRDTRFLQEQQGYLRSPEGLQNRYNKLKGHVSRIHGSHINNPAAAGSRKYQRQIQELKRLHQQLYPSQPFSFNLF